MGLREGRACVCVPCIIVGLQAYVCIHSAHCKKVVRCWFTFQHVIEKENRYKSLVPPEKKVLLGSETNRLALVLDSAFSGFCAGSRQMSTLYNSRIQTSTFLSNVTWFLALSFYTYLQLFFVSLSHFKKRNGSKAHSAFQCGRRFKKLFIASVGFMKSVLNLIVLLTTRAKQTGGIICDTYQTAKTHGSDSVNQQSHLSRA